MLEIIRLRHVVGLTMLLLSSLSASAAVLRYGDQDALGTGVYGADDPKAGATLEGLAANATSAATKSYGHFFPFTPDVTDFAGTDQIYAGSVQTGFHDGYSSSNRLNGPQVLSLDYSSLHPANEHITSFTLGIAADDFQFPSLGQPFVAKINGVDHAALTTLLNTIDEGGAQVQFFTIGLDPTLLANSDILQISIDQGGDGGDGWAVDFLTVGVQTSPVPVPAALYLMGSALAAFGIRRRAK